MTYLKTIANDQTFTVFHVRNVLKWSWTCTLEEIFFKRNILWDFPACGGRASFHFVREWGPKIWERARAARPEILLWRSGTDWCRLPSVSSWRETCRSPRPSTRGGTEGRASARRGSRWREEGLYGGRPGNNKKVFMKTVKQWVACINKITHWSNTLKSIKIITNLIKLPQNL